MFTDSDIEHQRVCFRTRPGLEHEPLKVDIVRLANTNLENLSWDVSCGEDSFYLSAVGVAAGTYPLPYGEEKQ